MASESANPGLSVSCWDLCGLAEDELNSWDIAALNLLSAAGLPGMDAVDVVACLDKLDAWADRVKIGTLRQMHQFDPVSPIPAGELNFGNSLARFCCYMLLQVLQEDCGVVYNPDRKFDPHFGDASDLFIHGILDEHGGGGTCATMPVVYVAVGRRLGFPVRLVETREHLFFRWDDPRGAAVRWEQPEIEFWIPPDRFNVEGAGEGIGYFSDAHYTEWPHPWKEPDFEHGRYLRSRGVKEELAGFLIARGECFFEAGNWHESLKAYAYARQLAPDDPRYEWLHAKRTKEIRDREAAMRDMLEMQRERHAARQSLPGVVGHSRNCCCLNCEQLRDVAQSRPVAPHGGSCQCRHCKIAREAAEAPAGMPGHLPTCQCAGCLDERSSIQSRLFPPHGPSCQCWDCKAAREAAESPAGMPGHPPTCQCAGCLHERTLPQPSSPHTTAMHHPAPQIPSPHHPPSQPNIANPKRLGLPGF